MRAKETRDRIWFRFGGKDIICCGQKMTEIVPGTTEASAEKYIPVYQVETVYACCNLHSP